MRASLVTVLIACIAAVPVFSQQGAPASETPAQFYFRYMKAVSAATTLEQVVSFWSNDQRQKFAAATPAERPALDEIKAFFKSVSGMKVLEGSNAPNTAVVEADGTMGGKPVTVKMLLTREQDGWKVSSGPDHWR